MVRVNVLTISALASVAMFVTPVARAATFDLNVDLCTTSCLAPGTSGGTVELTLGDGTAKNGQGGVIATGDVDMLVQLNPDLFHFTTGLDTFMFQISTGPTITTSIVNAGGNTWSLINNGTDTGQLDGAGHFGYAWSCQSTCSPNPNGNVFEFNVHAATAFTSLTPFESLTTGTITSKYDFAANVSTGAGSSCTGLIAGGNGTSQTSPSATGTPGTCTPSVPEPNSVAFFATGLLGLGLIVRKKFVASW
jgi:hypothetical protein